ncbi:extracellular solute-binding protein [Anaeromicropila herbilytica]|uniref:ABC transporter substrate-binding protein n=1 Tax=Anaeromicropila herbilytica TaxID=2785025 RepID=A0A7R7IFC3_9FIRM|nr:extracellular solute-binding protein [Anaeromicropila herbilytica]BCN32946.1 ABC transporter substrate-binding protein [Anaeromicropila herbilytica]
MKKTKKLFALLMVMVMVFSLLTACGKSKDTKETGSSSDKKTEETKTDSTEAKETKAPALKDASLKVWGPQEQQATLKELCNEFQAKHPEAKFTFEFGVVSEADAKDNALRDLSKAADVFTFSSDQLGALKDAGALYRVTLNKDAIVAANSESSIKACTVDGEMYAYPSSAETYFLMYDKSKYTEDEVKSIDTMVNKDLGDGITNFSFDSDNGWYLSSFFFAAGCQLFGPDGTDATQCDFNNAQGLMVGKYLLNLVKNKKVANHDDGKLQTAFKEKKLGATITGSWNADAVKKALGENYGVAKLPTIKLEDGNEYPLSGMANFKLYGVNAQTKAPAESMALAEFLTSKDAQKVRFEKHNAAPTNIELASDTATLSANATVQAVTDASQVATLQTSIPQSGNFWTPAEAFGQGLADGSITESNMQEKLDKFVTNVLAALK